MMDRPPGYWTRGVSEDVEGPPRLEPSEEAAWKRARKAPASWLTTRLPRTISFWAGAAILGFFGIVALYAVIVYWSAGTFLTINVAYTEYIVPPGPSRAYPFGINNVLGVDMLEAVVRATPWDVAIVGGIVVGAALLGLLVGALAAAGIGTRADLTLTSFTDVLATVPAFFLVFVFFLPLAVFVSPNDYLVLFTVLFILVLWPYHARAVRARARQIEREPFVDSARASGATRRRVLFHHILPNVYTPVLAQIPVDVLTIFFALTVFPYVHCQNLPPRMLFFNTIPYTTPLPPPSVLFPEWGNLLAIGACYGWAPVWGANFWWMYAFPAAAIILFTLGVALVCDGLVRRVSRI